MSGIVCPNCGSDQHGVRDSRPCDGGVRRRRLCWNCDQKFTTLESAFGLTDQIGLQLQDSEAIVVAVIRSEAARIIEVWNHHRYAREFINRSLMEIGIDINLPSTLCVGTVEHSEALDRLTVALTRRVYVAVDANAEGELSKESAA